MGPEFCFELSQQGPMLAIFLSQASRCLPGFGGQVRGPTALPETPGTWG